MARAASVYSVAQVNAYIKNMFAQDFALSRISVKGEVSNCKYHSSGHIYFTLKDGLGAIQAVMFAGKRRGLNFVLEEGQQVVVKGSVEVYERDGRYQLYAAEITLDGTGDLFKRFEKLRNELEEMGMFAPEYKSPIPKYAMKVGIVTASTGAAIRDIINIARRRNPYVQLVLCPAQVQGEGAASSIARGIETLDAMGLDVLIVGRGGGSIEDLWAFNEETVARAIFACKTPVISAVGHETDFTIADFVADLRAETPTAAADLAVPDTGLIHEDLEFYRKEMMRSLELLVEKKKRRMALCSMENFERDIRGRIAMEQMRIDHMAEQMKQQLLAKEETCRSRLELLRETVEAADPNRILQKGYTILRDEEGNVILDVAALRKDQDVSLEGAGGFAEAKVVSARKKAGKKAEKR